VALYVVGTPIGNLEDITLRALRVLREVALIAAEDTRKTRRLLHAYSIKTALTSFHEFTGEEKVQKLASILQEKDVALVSEAGTPGISDPGYALIAAAVERGVPVVPVPGPSAVTAALSVAGLPADQFLFLGFLPRRVLERGKLLRAVAGERRTLVAFEAPHRLQESLADLLAVLGNRPVAVCRELTKVHEEIWRGRIGEALQHFTSPLGEFTLVIAGNQEPVTLPQNTEIRDRLTKYVYEGLSGKEAMRRLAKETGLPRREIYRLWLEVADEQS